MPFVLRLLSCVFLLTLSGIIAAANARADDTNSPSSVDALLKAVNEQAERLNAQEKKLEDSKKALDEQQKALLQERVKFNELRAKVSSVTGKALPEIKPSQAATADKAANVKSAEASEPSRVVPPTSPPTSAEVAAAAGTPQEVGTEKKQDASKPPDITALTDVGGVLLHQGQLVVTPALEYTHSSATAVTIQGISILPALNIGLFEISKVDSDVYTASMDALYGLTNKWEIEAKVPYVYRTDGTLSRPVGSGSTTNTLYSADGHDVGDIEFSTHYQMNSGTNGLPFLIGNMRFKTATGTSPYSIPTNTAGALIESPTGTGFYALQPSITAIYPSDPVVFYGNVGYLHSFTHNFGGTIGSINPGDDINASFGMSFSLNDKASWSLGYSHTVGLRPTENGASVPNTSLLQVGTLDLGYAYMLNDRTALNFLVSAGVTDDAPNVHLTFRVPLTYDLMH